MGDPIYRYMMIFVACVALLLGLQVPNFVDQYQKRVDAHLREVTVNLQPFQAIADKYFAGNMDKLIALHRGSTEKPFQEEGSALEQMVQRKLRFEADLAALNTSLPIKAFRVMFRGDREMIDETLGQFSYNVPMNRDALLFGAGFAFTLLLSLEGLLALARLITRKTLSPSKAQ
jgi:hypothetical protein